MKQNSNNAKSLHTPIDDEASEIAHNIQSGFSLLKYGSPLNA